MVTTSARLPAGTSPELSVIVATVEAARNIDRCLTSIRAATAGLDAEIWIVDASRDESARLAARQLGHERVIRCAPDTTTLTLWARGIERARGRVVALTTGHFQVEASWGRVLLGAIRGDVGGAAGAIILDADGSLVDEAVFYLRYASFLSRDYAPGRVIRMIPGDNAAYDASLLARHRSSYRLGFSEVDFHRRIFAEGKRLAVVSGATASFGPSYPLRVILRHRFAHGREFGAWRVREDGRRRLRLVLAAPLVPVTLAARAARNALPLRGHRLRFLRSLPLFLLLAAAWASGEFFGAILGDATPHANPAGA
jgi:glycosyltransferase involved in cell wall biosynthesis